MINNKTQSEQYRENLPIMPCCHSLGNSVQPDDDTVLSRLTPAASLFQSMEISESYNDIALGQALNEHTGLKRVYLDQDHDKLDMSRPLNVGIAQARFSSFAMVGKKRVMPVIVAAARLLLDVEISVGRFDVLYVELFIGPPDQESFFEILPPKIGVNKTWGKTSPVNNATGRVLGVLPRNSTVRTVGKSVDSVQVGQDVLNKYFKHYTAIGLRMSLRFGLGYSVAPPLPLDCFSRRGLSLTDWVATVMLMQRQ